MDRWILYFCFSLVSETKRFIKLNIKLLKTILKEFDAVTFGFCKFCIPYKNMEISSGFYLFIYKFFSLKSASATLARFVSSFEPFFFLFVFSF